jgi:hypothetical protein
MDLQGICGVPGAQEKFGRLVTEFVKGERPPATTARTVQVHGGIDAYVRALTAPAGMTCISRALLNEGGKPQKPRIEVRSRPNAVPT